MILSSHMMVRRERALLGELPRPENLRVRVTEVEGACDVVWKLVRGASAYEVEFKLQAEAAQWQRFVTVVASKVRVTGLTPGLLHYFRVRAIGAAGAGPWSDPALRRAP